VAGGDELFRRYLQTRVSLGEPETVLPGMSRREAKRMARRLAVRGPETLSALAGADKAAGAGGEDDAGVRAGTGGGAASPAPEEIERLAREGTADEISRLPDLETLRSVAEKCTRCPLHEGRKKVVFGEGDAGARLVCVGEAPGAREDETGRPFVGRAGALLDQLLLAVGFRREEVYICNVLKSRPPRNRDPRSEEIEACAPFLLRQVELLDPRVIVAFGAFASRTLLDTSGSLGSLRGRVHDFRGYPLVATYHPAALLRNPGWRRPTWEDLQRARRLVDVEDGRLAPAGGRDDDGEGS
jgi:DNA polymerase